MKQGQGRKPIACTARNSCNCAPSCPNAGRWWCSALRPVPQAKVWTMDFVADEFGEGGKFRMLTVVDVFTRQAMAVDVLTRYYKLFKTALV